MPTPRARTGPTLLLGLLVGVLAACSRPECERNSDCGAGRVCTPAGVCEARPFRPPGEVEDAGPPILRDLGTGARDAGGAPEDAGDSGAPDASEDAGGVDGGVGADSGLPDFGPLDGGVVENEGLVWIGEHTGVAVPAGHVLLGRFVDAVSSGLVTHRTPYASGSVVCELVRESRPATLVGFTASRIEVTGFANGSYTSVALSPSGPGTFGSGVTLGAGMFFGSPDALTFAIVSSGQIGTLAAHGLSLAPPYAFAPGVFSPQVGSVVLAQAPISVSWSPAPLQPSLSVVLELADAARTVRLSCVAPDGLGQVAIPDAARLAFLAAGPVAPVQLELRYQSERTEDVPVVGRSTEIPTRFRLSNGVRWAVQL